MRRARRAEGVAGGDLLASAFPFHLAVDEGLRVTRAGPALSRHVGVVVGRPLGSAFRLEEPAATPSFELFESAASAGTPLLLAHRDGLRLQGQGLVHGHEVLVLAAPAVSRIADLEPMGLTPDDLPAYGPWLGALAAGERLAQQLRQAGKMEAIGRLAGGVAHDFSNVLTAILSYAELLAFDLPPDDPKRQDVAEIRRAARQGAETTRQLLLFSRQEMVRPEVVELGALLGGTEKMLSRLLGDDVRLVLRPGRRSGRVFANPGELVQVVMNLVVNARDAMPEGGAVTVETSNVTVDARRAADLGGVRPGPYVVLSVADTGVGMDAETRARIFEPFFTTKERGRGTGLGLATTFGIVRGCGGAVDVESAPGRGATFRVYLPRTERPADTSASFEGPALLRYRGDESILVVDDDEIARTVMGAVLRRLGYDVFEAQNAGEALLVCETTKAPIDLLVTDVLMPRMSGPELAARLRRDWPDLRAVFVSGYAEEALAGKGVGGPATFVPKPVTPEALARQVRQVLDGAH